MKLKLNGFLVLLLALMTQITFAQERAVSGTVSDNTGLPLPGVSVLVKGTKTGTQTDFDGKYSIKVAPSQTLVFSYIGMKTQEVKAGSTTINVKLASSAIELEGAVVTTALGVKKAKKALGYASQEVKGNDIADVPVTNFADALSGEVAGLNVQSFGTLGGSANIVVRGFSSIYGNSQALIVIDGTPVINETNNSSNVASGRGGYDYGNAASDINPDDIESVNVLKGAAATALYGSRASNGALIITTKKGKNSKGIGVSVNSTISVGTADKNTLPVYQTKYGAGYGAYYDTPYFNLRDINGDGVDEVTVPFTEDASYGAAFDPNVLVYQWNSIYPQLPGYQKATPWVAAKNNPNTFWQDALTTTNSVSFGKSSDTGTFRLGFTNKIQEGIAPNSLLKRNTITFSGSQKLNDRLTVSGDFSYTNNTGRGRNGTGYSSGNPMQAFRQWFQTNVDIQEQKAAFFSTGQNITWNATEWNDLHPIYTDNVYWNTYKNYQTDSRDRYLGNFSATEKVNDWFNVVGKFAFDTYSEIREERIDVGSSDVSDYTVTNRKVAELNYDLMGNFSHNFNDNLNLNGIIGYNVRVRNYNALAASANGGLVTPGLFTLANSVNPLTSNDYGKTDYTKRVEGLFAKAGLEYKNTYYLDATFRRDRSSALPVSNNVYSYPSVASSIIFSNLLKKEWLTYGKFRANYAEVGNDTDPYQVFNTYTVGASFDGNATASNPSNFNNPNLKPETSKEFEIGLEMQFFKNRLGFDASYYKRKTVDLITPITVSNATGASNLWLNGGDLEKTGYEVILNATPIKTASFSWDIKVNWSTNETIITRLAEGIEFMQLASVQGGVTLGGALGEPFGTIRGKDLVYYNGDRTKPIVKTNGYYQLTTSTTEKIGNITPDWTGGIKNTFKYKNVSLSALVDIKKGGDVFSLDTWYGYATGLYDFTAGTNELGNPVRNSNANGGGIILPGVQANGTANTVRAAANSYANPWGYARAAQSQHVYDASFVKLREVSLSYVFPKDLSSKLSIENMSLSLIGRNLWIIHKNTPYSDPEAGLGAGNVQGYQSGAYPAVREVGASLKFEF